MSHARTGEPPDADITSVLSVGQSTVERIRKLLADQLVECEIVGTISTETVSTETVRQALKKKRTEAVAEAELVHPARSERGVCVRDGRRTGGLPTAVRWE